jgi:hypothetical protein
MSELSRIKQATRDASSLGQSFGQSFGHVIVIGGGIGGLTLAQGLKLAGVSVALYERDHSTTDRVQGYRVHINPTGSRALHACLPAPLFETFERTCGRPGRAIRFLTEQMEVLLSVDGELADRHDAIGRHRSVSRITLRQILLSGLDGIVHFGKTFTRYEERGQRLIAHFEDGTSAEGDVLVAAETAADRGCAASSCRMRNASIPASSASPARCSSMPETAIASRPSSSTGWRSWLPKAATASLWPCRRSMAQPWRR